MWPLTDLKKIYYPKTVFEILSMVLTECFPRIPFWISSKVFPMHVVKDPFSIIFKSSVMKFPQEFLQELLLKFPKKILQKFLKKFVSGTICSDFSDNFLADGFHKKKSEGRQKSGKNSQKVFFLGIPSDIPSKVSPDNF